MDQCLFALIDTETNWNDEVMSIGAVIADFHSFQAVDAVYCILTPEYLTGGMYSRTLDPKRRGVLLCSRREAVKAVKELLCRNKTDKLFAYNAAFDRAHLPELQHYAWFDIMKLAAYRQYNGKIPWDAPLCSTGRLKCNYGVEAMLRLLSGNCRYEEKHNALQDVYDELTIMKLLGHSFSLYEKYAGIG